MKEQFGFFYIEFTIELCSRFYLLPPIFKGSLFTAKLNERWLNLHNCLQSYKL